MFFAKKPNTKRPAQKQLQGNNLNPRTFQDLQIPKEWNRKLQKHRNDCAWSQAPPCNGSACSAAECSEGGHPLEQLLKAQHGHPRTEIAAAKQGWAQEGGSGLSARQAACNRSRITAPLIPFSLSEYSLYSAKCRLPPSPSSVEATLNYS